MSYYPKLMYQVLQTLLVHLNSTHLRMKMMLLKSQTKRKPFFLTMMDSILPMMSFWRQKNCDWFLPPCQSHPQLLLCHPSSQSGKRVHWSTFIHQQRRH
ncbi:unnamed protein product [Acanthoscelides obtectus]|uniref:Uncharacterized protein n=1 Tax=Acanthoscelides obtectus TaxID=200917 RepID=A0A9P0KC97_ACAOB|nr:unnamed protein product [Acanthoscelides obtectus]CAK1635243.1 hypothetical protein AOBTE_LOCUS9155 [Acanthoscelides obtectus]